MTFRELAMKMYVRAPRRLQQTIFEIEGARIAHERYGGDFPGILAAAKARDAWEEQETLEFRRTRLAMYLRRAAQTIPYVEGILKNHRIKPADIVANNVEEMLLMFPVMTKAEIKRNPEEFRARNVHRSKTVSTGGTSGNQLTFITTRAALQEQWAVWWRYRARFGIAPHVQAAHFGGKAILGRSPSTFSRRSRYMNLVYFSPNHIRGDTVGSYLRELNGMGALWIHGYPSVLWALARELSRSGLAPDSPVTWITTGAEGLDEPAADLISSVFGVRVRQHYGLAEAVANFSECERGSLHVDEDHSYVEFGLSSDEGRLRVIGTAFSNPAMGFVRYETGDVVELPEKECICGLPGRTVGRVLGRERDFVELGSGELLGPVNLIARELPSISGLQLQKTGPYALTAYVVADTDSAAVLESVARTVGSRANHSVEIHVVRVNEPMRTESGKAPAVLPESR